MTSFGTGYGKLDVDLCSFLNILVSLLHYGEYYILNYLFGTRYGYGKLAVDLCGFLFILVS